MGVFEPEGSMWHGDFEHDGYVVTVHMSDATYWKHRGIYLARCGCTTVTYAQLLAECERKTAEFFALQEETTRHLENLEYWLACADESVRIHHYPFLRPHMIGPR